MSGNLKGYWIAPSYVASVLAAGEVQDRLNGVVLVEPAPVADPPYFIRRGCVKPDNCDAYDARSCSRCDIRRRRETRPAGFGGDAA